MTNLDVNGRNRRHRRMEYDDIKPPTPVWEYHSSPMEIGADINGMGRDGWELITVLPVIGTSCAVYYFKRLKA